MRLASALLLLTLATPALADPPDAPVWSVDVHERRGGHSYDTVMTLTVPVVAGEDVWLVVDGVNADPFYAGEYILELNLAP